MTPHTPGRVTNQALKLSDQQTSNPSNLSQQVDVQALQAQMANLIALFLIMAQ